MRRTQTKENGILYGVILEDEVEQILKESDLKEFKTVKIHVLSASTSKWRWPASGTPSARKTRDACQRAPLSRTV